jgi:hypothetical protein
MSSGNYRIFILPFYVAYHELKKAIPEAETEKFDDLTNSIFSYIIGQGAVKQDIVEVYSAPLVEVLYAFSALQDKYLQPKTNFNIFEEYKELA